MDYSKNWLFALLSRQKAGSLWDEDVDLGVITKILGHRDISSSVEVYTHILEEKIDEVFNRIRSLKYENSKSGAK